jgi:hypothetical protein
MPSQERDEDPQGYRHEEQEARYFGYLPDLWDQDVQNRQDKIIPAEP